MSLVIISRSVLRIHALGLEKVKTYPLLYNGNLNKFRPQIDIHF